MDILKNTWKIVADLFNFLFHNKNLKRNIANALPYWTGAFIIGLVAAGYAKLFSLAEHETLVVYHHFGWSLFILTPVCFLVSWWMVKHFAPYSAGSGIPQVSAAIELTHPKHYYKVSSLLSIRIIIVKIVSNIIMVFGGGVTGREGPTIQISASIFKKINDFLPSWYPKISKRNMIVTGAAAGLAAAFNTPLGGIVFAIEELTKIHFNFFKSALLTGVIISGLTALNFFGPYLYLGYPVIGKISKWGIVVILLLSVVSGLAGSITGKIILFALGFKNSIRKNYQTVFYILLCGLAIATMAYFIDFRITGSGKDVMITTLFTNQKHVEWYLPLMRTVGLALSFSVGASGGIFAPSLSIGAALGGVFASLFHLSLEETNLIILCGMTGFLTGITRSPFTSSILVLEMTNSHSVIFYIMLTALLANIFANLVSRHSFYDHLKDFYIHEIHKSTPQTSEVSEIRPG